MKKYEGLFILDVADKEEVEKELIERIQQLIQQAGGRVETVQRMGARPFARSSRQRGSGHYVNFIFEAPPQAIAELNAKLHLETGMFRWHFAQAAPEAPVREPREPRATAESVTRRE